MTLLASLLFPLLLAAGDSPASAAASWFQWGGPTRDFQVAGRGLHWTGAAPRRVWQRDLGEGYSAVIGDTSRLYVMFRRGDAEIVQALDPGTGSPQWEREFPTKMPPKMFLDYGRGPNVTPAFADGRLFIATYTGQVAALDGQSGRTLWTRELWDEMKGTFRDVGYSNSPLIAGDLVILPIGGQGRAVAAFRQRDGSTAWMGGDFGNAMSSPILVQVGGEAQVIALMVEGVAGFDAASGAQRWFHAHKTDYDVNATTPVWHAASQTLVISSAYSVGTRAIRLRREGGRTVASEAWFNRRLRVHHGNMLVVGDHVYGSSGDFGPAPLTAVEVTSGRLAWQNRAFPKVTMVQAGDRTVVLDEDGRLAIATLSPSGLRVLQEASILTKLSWTTPTLIGTRLYIRDRKSLVALQLEEAAS